MIVGLDIASKTGIALWPKGAPAPLLSTVKLPGRPDDLALPMEALRSTLAAIHVREPITHLFFELPILPRVTQMATVYKLCALAGMAEWYGESIGAVVRAVQQQRWRKHFCGRGTGKSAELKAMAIKAAQMRGWAPADDHQADASGVLEYGLACLNIDRPWRDAHLLGGRVAA